VIRHWADRDFYQRGLVGVERFAEGASKHVRRFYAVRANAEGVAELDEIWIQQIGRNHFTAQIFLLDSFHIPIGVVVEHNGHRAYVVLDRSRQFVQREAETPVAIDRNDRDIGIANLGSKRGGEAKPERALVARRDVSPWFVDRESDIGPVRDLRLIFDRCLRREARRGWPARMSTEAEPSSPGRSRPA
jgi:hypothetical protein